ncbi:MAG: hypothetical protein C5B52_18755, partial [Bacteroidetes bacterium]
MANYPLKPTGFTESQKPQGMKKLFTLNTILLTLFSLTAANAQVTEKFNTRPLAPSLPDVRPMLEGQCWEFKDMDINQNGLPAFEGDGTLVSGPGANSSQSTGFYTPLLDIPGSVNLYFRFKFNQAVNANSWFKIYLTNANNEIFQLLDSVNVTGDNGSTIYTYNKNLSGLPSGAYRIYFNFQGNNSDASIGVDDFYESVPLHYATGCNRAPGAEDDAVAGNINHTASGNVLNNDFDPDSEFFTAMLVTQSADGVVSLGQDGNFMFTPNEGFAGASTTFQYEIWDDGEPKLNSNVATVTISFATIGTLPVRFLSISAKPLGSSAVQLNWVTEAEVKNKQFEIQRSTDNGSEFNTVGLLFSLDANSNSVKSYQFKDELKGVSAKKIFYRIKQVDLDGNFSYSTVVIVNMDGSEDLNMVRISPNPVLSNFNINYDGKNKITSLRVIDLWGKEIYRQQINGISSTTLSLNASTANMNASGMYMVELIFEDGTKA